MSSRSWMRISVPLPDNFWSSHGASEFLEARFSRWDKTARDLLRAAPEWRKWPLADRNPAARLVSGRVALLGDAAHPMLPFLAQGAAQAIEDAGVLAEVLAQGQDVEASLRAYQETRLPRVDARAKRIAQASRDLPSWRPRRFSARCRDADARRRNHARALRLALSMRSMPREK